MAADYFEHGRILRSLFTFRHLKCDNCRVVSRYVVTTSSLNLPVFSFFQFPVPSTLKSLFRMIHSVELSDRIVEGREEGPCCIGLSLGEELQAWLLC